MKNLQLSLKKKWFDMTVSGEKTEDYREITPYWAKRLMSNTFYVVITTEKLLECIKSDKYINRFKPFTQNTMTLGYPKSNDTDRIAVFEHKGIEIRTGKPEWGAEPNKLYFVIKHGNRLK